MVGEHEVGGGANDGSHEGGREEPPHDLPVNAGAVSCTFWYHWRKAKSKWGFKGIKKKLGNVKQIKFSKFYKFLANWL
jgi:hypothetical protein